MEKATSPTVFIIEQNHNSFIKLHFKFLELLNLTFKKN